VTQGPRAFLCLASEDKAIARNIAENLQQNGIHTFFDEWDIQLGDSLRRKIEEGIESCTHFIPLLTPNSLKKPWVNEELDAGFVQKVSGNCRVIPILHEVEPTQISPFLQATLYLELNKDPELKKLISNIHGYIERPPLGKAPLKVSTWKYHSDLSPMAQQIVELLLEKSENGMSGDPQIHGKDIASFFDGVSEEDIGDGLNEIFYRGYIQDGRTMCSYPGNFLYIAPTNELFVDFDAYIKDWDPEDDAFTVATYLVNSGEQNTEIIAAKLQWLPRRLNPALSFLIRQNIIDALITCGSYPYVSLHILTDYKTRKFVKDNG
jgi:hypothetical protein